MKRLLITLLASLSLLLPVAISAPAGATNIFGGCGSGSAAGTPHVCQSVNEQTGNPIVKILKAAIEVITYIAGGLAVIFILVSSLKFIIAGGGSEGVASARSTLIYTAVGIATLLLGQTLILFVINRL